MLDALLAPVSGEHARRHLKNKLDAFYRQLTRDAVQSQLRADMLDNHRQGLAAKLRQATRTQNAIRQTFDDFAISVDDISGKVWMKSQFEAFVTNRTREANGHNTSLLSAASVLWHCLCYNASYPFVEADFDPNQQHIDLAGWIQGLALLTSDLTQSLGRNRAVLSVYGNAETSAARRDSTWRRFVSFSSCSQPSEDPIADLGDWRPPDMVDEIARTVATQLPLPMNMKVPPLSDIRPRVHILVPASSNARNELNSLVISYEDMRSLLLAILQVSKGGESTASAEDPSWRHLSLENSADDLIATAESILEAGGIDKRHNVTFAKYLAFSERFRRSDNFSTWSFDEEVVELWRALLCVEDSRRLSSTPSSQHASSSILQALNFLCPLVQTSYDRQQRWQSTLTYSSSTVSGLPRDAMLQALTWPYSPKVAVVYGSTSTSSSRASAAADSQDQGLDDGQSSIFVVVNKSPLWCNYKTGQIDDFFVGDGHVLLELAPKARAMWCPHEQTKFVELVSVNSHTLSFGHRITEEDNPRPRSSGLHIDFEAGVATLRHAPSEAETREDDYVEVGVGPQDWPPKKLEQPQPWETVIRLRKIEVYSLPDGVEVGLGTKRLSGSD